MISLVALAPIASFAYHTFPIYKLSSKLYNRNIAIAGEKMARKYAACDYIVFKDMHLFQKAKPQNNGIVIYDDRRSKLILEYLDTLYAAIGGPMKDIFGGEGAKRHTIKLRRIARNGIEAVVDAKHSVIFGDALFMQRYGISFDSLESKRRGEGILGFALDGRPAAKLCLKYETEPLFEMLLSKLSEEKIGCAIETYDPLINSKYISECRTSDAVTINVIHKNVSDYYSNAKTYRNENTGLVVCASRLKLVEGVVWCKRICKIWKICSICQFVTYGLAFMGLILATVFGFSEYVSQYMVLALQLVSVLPTLVSMLTMFPPRDHFSTEQNN
jgi:hypothetical protein